MSSAAPRPLIEGVKLPAITHRMASVETNLPPQNLEAEESVLGAMMVSESAIEPVLIDVRLREEDFYRERHRLVFHAIRTWTSAARRWMRSPSPSSSRRRACSPRPAARTPSSPSPPPLRPQATPAITPGSSSRTRCCGGCSTTAQQIERSVRQHEGEPRELVERAEGLLFEVAHEPAGRGLPRARPDPRERGGPAREIAKNGGGITGTPSGLADLDAITGGFQPGNLIILAARPGMGKSGLVANIAEHVATKEHRPVAFFSLEMSEMELAQRLIAKRAKIPSDKLRKGRVSEGDWKRVLRVCNELESLRSGSTSPRTSPFSTCGARPAACTPARSRPVAAASR